MWWGGALEGSAAQAFVNLVVEAHEGAAWPTNHNIITSGYSTNRLDPVSGYSFRGHQAIDIKNPEGDFVYSMFTGTVRIVDTGSFSGNFIKITHSDGLESSYSHTESSVKQGEFVTRGQKIGKSDGSGRGTAPHLHLVLRKNGRKVNPCTELNCP